MRNWLIATVLTAGSCTSLAQVAGQPPQPSAAAPTMSTPRAAAAADLPITRITLYRSGVGSFLRQGRVEGAGKVQLKFDIEQLNDVLKSVQVVDLDGGRIEALSFASKDPLERRLSAFSINLADNPSMPELLGRLRGSPVMLRTASEELTGTVLSVEMRKEPAGTAADKSVVEAWYVNLITPGGIRSVPVAGLRNFTVQDPTIAEEMSKALQALAESRAERVKTVDIAMNGNGERRVAVAYVHETPVWKTSYRLILPEPAEPGKPDPKNVGPVLKGWALVENTTDNDWSNVRLALVSGRPVSFKMDLSEPMYVWRPQVPVPTVAGVMPKEYEGGVGGRSPFSSAGAPGGPPASPAPAMELDRMMDGRQLRAGRSQPGARSESKLSSDELISYGEKALAKGGEVGEMFQFELNEPVTIGRQRSAMIPILDANLSGRRVSIYNRADRADHPMRGVEITNTTGGQLLPGPLAVYDGAAYAGDAQIGQVSAGDKRLLAYALDLDVAVTTQSRDDYDIVSIRIIDGMFEQSYKQREGIEYAFENKDQRRGRAIVVEHPRLDGWTLLGEAKPIESTQGLLRFEVPVDAGKAATLSVVHERTDRQRVAFAQYNLAQVLDFRKQGKLSEEVVNAVRDAARRQETIRTLEVKLAELDRQIETLKKDQSQLVDMMSKLKGDNPNYDAFSKRLTTSNTRLEAVEAERVSTAGNLEKAREDLAAFLRGLKVE